MTLIWSATKPYPLLLGDLAITIPYRRQGFGGPLPTVGKALGPHAKVGGRYLTGLTQKVCVLGPRLTIAWSDSPHAARVVLKAARERYGSIGVDGPEMGRLLMQLGYNDGKIDGLGLSIIGMSIVDDYTIHLFSFGNDVRLFQDNAEFRVLRVCGSGVAHLFHKLPAAGNEKPFDNLAGMKESAESVLGEFQYSISRMLRKENP